MTNPFRGLYRTVTGAYVTGGTMAFEVPEPDYRALGYEPDYEDLPWKDDLPRKEDCEVENLGSVHRVSRDGCRDQARPWLRA